MLRFLIPRREISINIRPSPGIIVLDYSFADEFRFEIAGRNYEERLRGRTVRSDCKGRSRGDSVLRLHQCNVVNLQVSESEKFE